VIYIVTTLSTFRIDSNQNALLNKEQSVNFIK
jgi:hypothetical protein